MIFFMIKPIIRYKTARGTLRDASGSVKRISEAEVLVGECGELANRRIGESPVRRFADSSIRRLNGERDDRFVGFGLHKSLPALPGRDRVVAQLGFHTKL